MQARLFLRRSAGPARAWVRADNLLYSNFNWTYALRRTERPTGIGYRRAYSVPPAAAGLSNLPDIDAAQLTVEQTSRPKALQKPEELIFGHAFSDHMLSVEWTATTGWLPPRITPYQNLSLDPATCVFHYAFECFEGLKAYKGADGRPRLFRPDRNMARMNRSADRIALPQFDGVQMVDLMKRFVKLEERFIPNIRGYSLYLRPTLIGTQRTLGVSPSGSALLYLIASPVGPYYPTGFKAISLEATDYAVRAWPGGVGDRKLGANYAPCVKPQMQAASRGFAQNLWLFGEDQKLTEVGTMNLFVVLRDPATGQKEIATAPLDGTILDGVTRDSVLALARERLAPLGYTINERYVTMLEIAKASEEGNLLETFGAGTAVIISPVRNISWQDRLINCGLKENEEGGPIATQLRDWIEGIQYGEEPDNPWSVPV